MTNLEKLNDIICEVFSVTPSLLGSTFNNKNIDGWDSVRQLSLANSVEDAFDIMLDPEDIICFTSYVNIVELLKNKYKFS